ncbi:hypothetical protein SLEP1_g27627 [Rubroshorea leprosula]|uniref:Secreted protein n=1 Tax=Rubroshorea leprosula TaxID=152421 RepID=A0AAV5JWK0_9ROSI|nr:hypothetical protein SLEP1_g27627 [Rubroshorea leprosula]
MTSCPACFCSFSFSSASNKHPAKPDNTPLGKPNFWICSVLLAPVRELLLPVRVLLVFCSSPRSYQPSHRQLQFLCLRNFLVVRADTWGARESDELGN